MNADRVNEALDAVARERRRCVDERTAFESFVESVRDLRPAGAVRPVPALGPTGGQSDGAAAVRAAYERTVMSVPHYADDYGETFAENVAEEFGPDVATVLMAGTFTPGIRDRVVAAAERAENERAILLERLEREAESLRAGRRRLVDQYRGLRRRDDTPLCDRGFEDLRYLLAALDDCESRLDEVARKRQATLAEHDRTFGWTDATFSAYLYGEHGGPYPLLAATARLCRTVAVARRRVVRALTATA